MALQRFPSINVVVLLPELCPQEKRDFPIRRDGELFIRGGLFSGPNTIDFRKSSFSVISVASSSQNPKSSSSFISTAISSNSPSWAVHFPTFSTVMALIYFIRNPSSKSSIIFKTEPSNHCFFYLPSLASFAYLLSSFSFGSSLTSDLFRIESPLPMHSFKIKEKWLSLFMIFFIPSKGVSIVLSFYLSAQRLRNVSWRILAHLRVSLIGQSLMVLSYTTALFWTSFPERREAYLLFSSEEIEVLGSMLLQTSPKTQYAPLQISISTILELLIFIAIFRGDIQALGGLGEHFITLTTCLNMLMSPEQTAECIIDT